MRPASHSRIAQARIAASEEAISGFKKREADAIAEKDRMIKSSGSNMALRQKDLGVLRDAANRWTDNCFELKKCLVEKFNMDPAQVDKELGTGNMDFIE